MMTFPCRHPMSPSNTQEISSKYPNGRCRYCRQTARHKREGRDIDLPEPRMIQLNQWRPLPIPKPPQTGERSYNLAPQRNA